MSRPVPKATGKRYRTTSEMLEDSGTSKEIIDSVKEVEAQTAVPLLVGLRVSKGLTQKDLAKAIGCSQGRISKLETGRDEDLRLQDIIDYTRAIDGGVWITIVRPATLVEHIKLHIRALRQLTEELVSLTGEDHAISEGVNTFLDDLLLETGRIVENSKEKLVKKEVESKKSELEITVLGGGERKLGARSIHGLPQSADSVAAVKKR
ncbi:MAG: transcriptional regulator [Verrucomicrobia bacterium]|nr:transcriptional regulator [Verrucomicrobiota bacterium]MBV8274841.1 transcriptional regulator [Verrucomicrobiota bacterium]